MTALEVAGAALGASLAIGGAVVAVLNKLWSGRWWPPCPPERPAIPRADVRKRRAPAGEFRRGQNTNPNSERR